MCCEAQYQPAKQHKQNLRNKQRQSKLDPKTFPVRRPKCSIADLHPPLYGAATTKTVRKTNISTVKRLASKLSMPISPADSSEMVSKAMDPHERPREP